MSGYNDEFKIAKDTRSNAEENDRQAEHDGQGQLDEAALEATKGRLQQRWLSDHPGKTAEDFDTTAWPGLREKLLNEGREAVLEGEIDRQRQQSEHTQ